MSRSVTLGITWPQLGAGLSFRRTCASPTLGFRASQAAVQGQKVRRRLRRLHGLVGPTSDLFCGMHFQNIAYYSLHRQPCVEVRGTGTSKAHALAMDAARLPRQDAAHHHHSIFIKHMHWQWTRLGCRGGTRLITIIPYLFPARQHTAAITALAYWRPCARNLMCACHAHIVQRLLNHILYWYSCRADWLSANKRASKTMHRQRGALLKSRPG
jgi:hypothetical protein